MTPDARRALGAAGEEAVAAWYVRAGFTVLDRNWRCRDGELDVVVAGRDLLVFCEVKTRRSARFGAPVEAVTAAKQARLRRLAGRWLEAHGTGGRAVRFDVASVVPGSGGGLEVSVLEAAF